MSTEELGCLELVDAVHEVVDHIDVFRGFFLRFDQECSLEAVQVTHGHLGLRCAPGSGGVA